MPIPILIGGLVAAAAAVVAAIALKKNNDKPSSSGSSSGSDEAERGRRDLEKKERKERERTQKKEAAHEDFLTQGGVFGKSLAQALPSDLVKAKSRGAFTLDFDLKKRSMQFDMEEASQRDADLLATIDDLQTILTKRASHQKIIENLVIFSEVYKPEFQYGAALQIKKERVIRIDEGIEKLKEVKSQLKKLDNETASAQA